MIVAINNIAKFDRDQDLSFCSGVLVRENKGYDFAAWATAIRLIPDINRVGVLVMANDSVFGPLSGFTNFLGRMIESPADLVGAIGSRQNRPHTQSFLLMFKPKALLSSAFGQFWHGIRNGDREWAIVNYELKLKKHFMDHGLSVEEIFTTPSYLSNNTNPSLLLWKELVEQGFPFVKVQLLRDNPLQEDLTGWQEFLDRHEYDPKIVERYISSLDLYR
ncbi:rhamnan synthesis F family protein (plasmid) [Sphingomonas sp. NY01]|uniref:rhamnan synthesis F family protein n=1 Tax=Sphingomonas sp. NY01 TaxID=2968057 RepID=UPI00315CCDD9